jgi:hypothetical protein
MHEMNAMSLMFRRNGTSLLASRSDGPEIVRSQHRRLAWKRRMERLYRHREAMDQRLYGGRWRGEKLRRVINVVTMVYLLFLLYAIKGFIRWRLIGS